MQRKLKHNILIFYTLKSLSQKDKVKVLRGLQGYKEKKSGKLYVHEGLVQKLNSEKLGSNVILVPIENYVEFQNFFSKNNINIEVKEAWLK